MNNESKTFYKLKYSAWPTSGDIENIYNTEFGELVLYEWLIDTIMLISELDIFTAIKRIEHFTSRTSLLYEVIELVKDTEELKPGLNDEQKHMILNLFCEWVAIMDVDENA